MASVTLSHDQILEEQMYGSSMRILTLNRPKQLNVMSIQMISRLLKLFQNYEDEFNVKLVLLKGKGRAFCAGGDVVEVVRSINDGDWSAGAEFFRRLFTLNYILATYSKPQVSILNGIVMGGGAGVSIHGRFRVATENSIFAMPETTLGHFPDVGASYFLSRLPGFFGEYVALTGARLDGAEMLACGLATHFVSSSILSLLEEALCKVDSSKHAAVSAIIDQYSHEPCLEDHSVYHRMPMIDKCFSQRSVEEIISAPGELMTLKEREKICATDKWVSITIRSLKKASPISLKLCLRSIREGRLQGVGQCLIREYRMVCNGIKGEFSKDFSEGCRAILLDKDNNPKWEPSKLELVSDNMVNQYFSKVNDENWEDLKLPFRPNLATNVIAKL